MGFTSLKTFDFRNLKNQKIEVGHKEIFLTGENGQGKSNFLEAVYILSYGSSFRTHQDSLLIKHNCKDFIIIERGNEKPGKIAKLIQNKIKGELDDIIRALPAGSFKVKK